MKREADKQDVRRRASSALLRRVEFGDGLLLVYVAVFVRQYFWGVENAAAWMLTTLVALPLWWLYVATKTDEEMRGDQARGGESVRAVAVKFWLIVAPPLLFFYSLRVAFPDTSFDVWGLRLFHAERALRGYLYLPGEFFPVGAPFNPAPDMVTGLFRHLLGYRLGTIANLLALLWTGRVAEKLLRPYVASGWLRAACVLLCLLAEHLLFLVNNYMVDLLALPLLLEATRLALGDPARRAEPRTLVRIAFLVGAASALKLSNAAAAAPIVALCVWHAFARRPFVYARLAKTAAGALSLFLAPSLPCLLYVYKLTGSPVFPVYNSLFRSPFYPPLDTFDARWGGYGAFEVLLWPLLTPFVPARLSELGVYSGRIALGTLVAAALLLLARRRTDAPARQLCLMFVAGALLWSQSSGYVRYGLHLEVLSGVLTVIAASRMLRVLHRVRRAASGVNEATNTATTSNERDATSTANVASATSAASVASAHGRLRLLAASLLACTLLAQSALASLYTMRLEWGMRPTFFAQPQAYVSEARYILRDHRLRAFLPRRERELFRQAGVWVVSGAKTAGLLALLDPRGTPFVGARTSTYFAATPSREWFARSLAGFSDRPAYSLCLPVDCPAAFTELRYTGLETGQMTKVTLPFFSREHRVEFYFYEVRQVRAVGERRIERSAADAPLPTGEPRAEIVSREPPRAARPGERLTFFFTARNTGTALWPSLAAADGRGRIVLRARWLANEERRAPAGEASVPLHYDLPPGEIMPLPIELSAPPAAGQYLLEVSVIHEGFADAHAQPPLLLPFAVER